MSAEAFALSFFDPDRQLYGTARSGATLLFHGRQPTALAEGPEVERDGAGWRAELGDRLSLRLEPTTREVELDGVTAQLCRAVGEVGAVKVDCLGSFSITTVAPRWEELQALRSISAIVDERHGLLLLARRLRDAAGHGDELVQAGLFVDGELKQVSEAGPRRCTTPAGASAAPAWSSGCRTRTSRGAAPGR